MVVPYLLLPDQIMTKKPLVSLIVVNYNGFLITKKMIQSIRKNTKYSSYEMIVVDNASSDQSPIKLKQYLKSIDNTVLVNRQNNDFLTGGYNAGYKSANGQILIFMNNDLVMTKNWLDPLVSALQKPDIGIAGSAMLSFSQKDTIDHLGSRLNWLGFGFRIDAGKKFKPISKLKQVDFVPGSLIAIKKKLFEQLGKFDEDYLGNYEDVDLAWRAKKAGYKSVIALNSVVYHRGSWTVNKEQKKAYSSYLCRKNRLMTLIKNASLLRLILSLPIYLVTQIGIFFKELIFNRNFKLAIASIKAIVWNVINLPKNISKRVNLTYLFNLYRYWELKKILNQSHFSLLDLGCGRSVFLRIAERENNTVIGVDKKKENNDNIIKSKIESFSIDKKFDVVTLYHVLEHLKKPEIGIRVAKKHLKADGLIVIETPLIGNLTEKFLGKDYFAYFDQSHLSLFSLDQLIQLLNQTNLKIISKGVTCHEFPITLITTSFRQNFFKGILSIFLFIPIKTYNWLNKKPDIIRLYLKPINGFTLT